VLSNPCKMQSKQRKTVIKSKHTQDEIQRQPDILLATQRFLYKDTKIPRHSRNNKDKERSYEIQVQLMRPRQRMITGYCGHSWLQRDPYEDPNRSVWPCV
jgi:hypothetical protein